MKMLARLFQKPAPPPPERPRWEVSAVAELLRHFPIGGRILYCPESKRDLRLDSIILGCTVNRRFVFSQAQIRLNGDHLLLLGGDDGETAVHEVHSFCYLVPYQTRTEIDYQGNEGDGAAARLFQKGVNDFERHSVVTLIAVSPQGRVPYMEAGVRSTTLLSSGFYASHRVVVLDPHLQTLSHLDKRRHHRVSTRIPLGLRLGPDAAPVACVLEDFSEKFVRLQLGDSAQASDELAVGRRVGLTLDLGDRARAFTLQGTVHRKSRGAVVIELKAIHKDGRFVELQLVDQLDLKARLLNHPATQEALRGSRA